MLEKILIFSLVISVIAFFNHLYKLSKTKKILIVDKCAECPFMRQVPSPSEVDYKCSARMQDETFESLKSMNDSCEFGGQIEIKISKK